MTMEVGTMEQAPLPLSMGHKEDIHNTENDHATAAAPGTIEEKANSTCSNNNNKRLDFGALLDHTMSCTGSIRKREVTQLLGYAASTERKPTLWIEAEAGVGKSALLLQFREELERCNITTSSSTDNVQTVTIQGKFEQRAAASEPFAALREAVAELVHHVLLLEKASRQQWAQGLQEALGAGLPLLLSILPVLRQLLPNSSSMEPETPEDNSNQCTKDTCSNAFGDFKFREYRFERFRLGFRSLIRFACAHLAKSEKHNQTLVFMLDDWHWCDPDSLQIVKTLMEDARKPTNLLLIVATRPIQEYPHLNEIFRKLTSEDSGDLSNINSNSLPMAAQAPSEKGCIQMEEKLRLIGIPRLSASEIGDILTTLLGRCQCQDGVMEFAEIVQRKTHGNSFVVLQFLRLVERSGHVYFSQNDNTWQFDLQSIDLVDNISDNVSMVVANNLESGDKRRRSALMVAASFGVSQFDVATIVHAVKVLEQQDQKEATPIGAHEIEDNEEEYEDPYVVRQRVSHMSMAFTDAALDGYVEETSPGHFRFAHDRIRESAYSLLPQGNARKSVHLQVGRQLRSWMDTQSELGLSQSGFSKESLLLHATKQLNAGADLIDDDWELLDLADLNYQAAELAARKTAFFSSIEYLHTGLSHLGASEEAWERRYERTLSFCVALTRMQFSCGLLGECWETGTLVIEHAKTFSDKIRIYHTQILCLMQKGAMDAALRQVLDVFDTMGQPMPRRMVIYHVFREYMKAQKFLKGAKDEDLLNLPSVFDDDLEIYLDLLQSLAEVAFLNGQVGYLMLVVFRYLGLVSQHGNYPRSFFAYNLYACFFKPQMGDFIEAAHYSKLADTMSKRQRTAVPGFAARSDEMSCSYVQHWQTPIRASLQPNIDGFQRLWESGLIDTALMDASTLLQHFFAAGEPLERTIKECALYSEAFEDYKQMGHWYINASQHQAMLNLQGSSDNPAVCSGAIMNAEGCLGSWKATRNLPALYNFQFWSMVLGYHFHDLQPARRHIKAMRADLFEDGSCVLVPLRPFYTGLVYYKLYKETGTGKYRGRARKALKQLQQWASKGSVNSAYMCRILEAEDLSSRRGSNLESTMVAFDSAIKSTVELDICHHCALAHELAGSYLLSKDEATRATPYLNRAVEFYRKWGALAVVEDLKSRYPFLSV